MGGLGDFFLGDKDPGKAPDPIAEDIKATQFKASGLQNTILDDYKKRYLSLPVEQEAQDDIQNQQNYLNGQEGDSSRRIKEMLAQRGISNSGIGQGLQLGAEDEFQGRRDDIAASLPQRIRELREKRTGESVNLGSSVLGSQNLPVDFYGKKPERTGGALPLVTGAIGGYFGGPAGASAGYGLGQAAIGYQNSKY